jgi:ryanodine receptor 2
MQSVSKMNYQPKPIDTTATKLSPALAALTERLAENAHDLWAAQRLKDGWTWGAQRDDKEKKHPCLIPYADLPDSEKEYDRQAAMQGSSDHP